MRPEIATDITGKLQNTMDLAAALPAEPTLVHCIGMLRKGRDIDTAINCLSDHAAPSAIEF
ncbi:hypothetical protein HMPREF0980_01689 [Dorea sp. D27]|nr:hypothetical protein HMPREF0980_01689 [Dorea sp. D27]